jgi:hypothetical protein
MKKILVTLALAFAAFVAGFILVTGLVYAVWYVRSWEYIHSPRLSPSDPHDAAAMALMGMEMLIGLPGGILTGLIASALVVVWKWNRSLRREKEQSGG